MAAHQFGHGDELVAAGAQGADDVGDGIALYNEGKFAEAEAKLRGASGTEAGAYLAASLAKQKKYAEAEAPALAALKESPTHGVALSALGEALFEQKKYDEAITQYKTAISIDPTLKQPYINLAGLYKLQGDLEAALKVLDDAGTALNETDKASVEKFQESLTSTTTYYAQDSACYRSARVAIQVTVSPAINANVIVDGYQLTAEATGFDYQWIDCNNGSAPIANATEQTYEAPVSGSYAVVLTAGECSVTSTCQVVISTATAGTTMEHGVKVYPVPARDELWVSSVQQGGLYIELLDMTGRVVMQRAHQGDLFRSEIEHLPRGCYTVRVRSGSTTSSHRVVLQ